MKYYINTKTKKNIIVEQQLKIKMCSFLAIYKENIMLLRSYKEGWIWRKGGAKTAIDRSGY